MENILEKNIAYLQQSNISILLVHVTDQRSLHVQWMRVCHKTKTGKNIKIKK